MKAAKTKIRGSSAPNSLFKSSQTVSWDASKIAKTSAKCGLGRRDAQICGQPGGEELVPSALIQIKPTKAKSSVFSVRNLCPVSASASAKAS